MTNGVQDFYHEAFGDFDPQGDDAFAAKLSICILAIDGRFDDLADLLTEGHPVGAVEGCPGWLIERRDPDASGCVLSCKEWPEGKRYRIYVDPNEFSIAHSEVFLDVKTFNDYVKSIVVFYSKKETNPCLLARVRTLIDL